MDLDHCRDQGLDACILRIGCAGSHSVPTYDANYRATVTGTCYSLEVEAGGKSYLLAGGMDATTVRGLQTDVNRALTPKLE